MKLIDFLRPLGYFKLANFRKAYVYFRAYGLRAFLQKVIARIFSAKHADLLAMPGVITVPPMKLYEIKERVVEAPEGSSVSVVIPALNAEEDFALLLPNILRQAGLESIEVVIVDSGSTDKTVERAASYGACVVNIPPEEFSHSYARNLGAEHATGNYILFMTQDALPTSTYWIYEMLDSLKDNVVAASCAEMPREDSDLFAQSGIYFHNRYLGIAQGNRILSMPRSVNYASLRANAQLSDVACLVRRDIFERYRFRRDYAEDLDLGMRLISDGHGLALLGLVGVIHSHNRPAYYHVRRAFADTCNLAGMFSDFPVPETYSDPAEALRDIVLSYNLVAGFVEDGLKDLSLPCTAKGVSERFSDYIRKHGNIHVGAITDLPEAEHCDKEFGDFIRTLTGDPSISETPEGGRHADFLPVRTIFSLMDYIDCTHRPIDQWLMADLKRSLYKSLAQGVGQVFAYCLCGEGEKMKALEKYREELAGGV